MICNSRSFLKACAVFAFAGALYAADETLPKADKVLDHYLEVTGGIDNYKKLKTEVTTATMEFIGKGIKAQLTDYKAEPNKSFSMVEIPGMGKIESGVTDGVAWERSPMMGPRIKEGDEKAVALRSATVGNELKWRELYPKVDGPTLDLVDGRPAYKLVLTPKEGGPVTRFYDKTSGLLIRMRSKNKSQMGEFDVEVNLGDYRKEGDFLIPHKMQQKVAGGEMLITIDTVKYNVDIPDSQFKLPEDIKALAEKAAAAPPAETKKKEEPKKK